MEVAYFDDLRVGQRLSSIGITLSEAQILDFALSFDPQPIHVDVHRSAKGPYGGLIASGIHTLAIAVRLIQDNKPWLETCLGAHGIEQLRWLLPVRPGDTLRLESEIGELRPSRSKPDRGTVMLHHRLFNQRDEVVLTFTVPEIVARRASPAAPHTT